MHCVDRLFPLFFFEEVPFRVRKPPFDDVRQDKSKKSDDMSVNERNIMCILITPITELLSSYWTVTGQ